MTDVLISKQRLRELETMADLGGELIDAMRLTPERQVNNTNDVLRWFERVNAVIARFQARAAVVKAMKDPSPGVSLRTNTDEP